MDSIGHKDTTLSLCHPCPPTYHHSTYTPHVRRLLVLICSFFAGPCLLSAFFLATSETNFLPNMSQRVSIVPALVAELERTRNLWVRRSPTLYHSNLSIQYGFYYMVFQYIKVSTLGVANREHQEHVHEHRPPTLQPTTILQEQCHAH